MRDTSMDEKDAGNDSKVAPRTSTDIRAALKIIKEQKVALSKSAGFTASKPIPSTRGGELASASLSYIQLKKELLRNNELFYDEDFPPEFNSIYYNEPYDSSLVWLRPGTICGNPEFIIDGATRFDVNQGELGDCWLLAAIGSLCTNKRLLDQVVPRDQSFHHEYCGLFYFNIWRFGKWKQVYVDDFLITRAEKLVFMHSETKNEFWSSLLEKAYAKECSSYESLSGGFTGEALEDFTGGIVESFPLYLEKPPDFSKILLKSYARRSLICSSIFAQSHEPRYSNGLVGGHAYSVTSVKQIKLKSGETVLLVRVRNPWGNDIEWIGRWSDGSKEWEMVSEEVKKEIGLRNKPDGEFWMCLQDFTKHFSLVEICHLGPQTFGDWGNTEGERWEMSFHNGEWIPFVSAGGCAKYLDSFGMNPQYRVEVVDVDDEDNTGTLIIGLMQKNRRRLREKGQDMLPIGYAIYEIDPSRRTPLDFLFFLTHETAAFTRSFESRREVTGRHKLKPGTYVVIPSTFEPNEPGEFLLRIFSEKTPFFEALDTKVSLITPEITVSPLDEQQVNRLRNIFTENVRELGEMDCSRLQQVLNTEFIQDSGLRLEPEPSKPCCVCCGGGSSGSFDQPNKSFQLDGAQTFPCNLLMSLENCNKSGELKFSEFKSLWERMHLWKTAFEKHDKDKRGYLPSYELRAALKATGMTVDNTSFKMLVMRHANGEGRIAFVEFITCCARLLSAFELLHAKTKALKGMVAFDQAAFFNNALCA